MRARSSIFLRGFAVLAVAAVAACAGREDSAAMPPAAVSLALPAAIQAEVEAAVAFEGERNVLAALADLARNHPEHAAAIAGNAAIELPNASHAALAGIVAEETATPEDARNVFLAVARQSEERLAGPIAAAVIAKAPESRPLVSAALRAVVEGTARTAAKTAPSRSRERFVKGGSFRPGYKPF